jgi:hypothetical protein
MVRQFSDAASVLAHTGAERRRLLDSAQLVERQAWQQFESLPEADAKDRVAALREVLRRQTQVVKLVGDLVALDVVAGDPSGGRVIDALEQALANGAATAGSETVEDHHR